MKDAVRDMHVHAFGALEVWQGAATLGVRSRSTSRGCAMPALGRGPGTAAEILDDRVRAVLCPDKIDTAQWLEVHNAAHRVGLSSTTTDDLRRHGVEPELGPASAAVASSSGSPAGSRSSSRCRSCTWRRRSTAAGARAQVRRSARRSSCTPSPGSRCTRGSRTCRRRGSSSACRGATAALRAGVNDLGGTLMNESISRAAGASHGQEMTPERMDEATAPRPHAAPAHDALRRRARGAPGGPRTARRRAPSRSTRPCTRRASCGPPGCCGRAACPSPADGGAPGVASGHARRPGGVRPRHAAARHRGLRVDGGRGRAGRHGRLAGSRRRSGRRRRTRGRRGLARSSAGSVRVGLPYACLGLTAELRATLQRDWWERSLEAAEPSSARRSSAASPEPGSTPASSTVRPSARSPRRHRPRRPPAPRCHPPQRRRRGRRGSGAAGRSAGPSYAQLVLDERDDAQRDGEDAGCKLPLRHRRPEDAERTQRDHAGGEDEHEQQQVALRPPQAEAEREAEDHRRDRDEGRDVRRQGVAGVIVVGVVVPVRTGIGHARDRNVSIPRFPLPCCYPPK